MRHIDFFRLCLIYLFHHPYFRAINPSISYRLGPKHRQRFLCEVRVTDQPYVGAGNSTNKKDAERNAARDFISFLVRTGKINPAEIPVDSGEGGGGDVPSAPAPTSAFHPGGQQSAHVFRDGYGPQDLGQAYRPIQQDRDGEGRGYGPQSYLDRAEQAAQMEEAESFDVNASIHGNWTIENAKAKLHQFMQMNKISADYRYKPVGPDHARYVSCCDHPPSTTAYLPCKKLAFASRFLR